MLPVDAFEVELELPAVAEHTHLLSHLGRAVVEQLDAGVVPIRLAVTGASKSSYRCELGVVAGLPEDRRAQTPSVFDFRPRRRENDPRSRPCSSYPRGSALRLEAMPATRRPPPSYWHRSPTHSSRTRTVANASDLNELPANALYVEGSVLARVLMGTVGLAAVRSNRVLVVADAHPDSFFSDQLLNSVNAARSSFGPHCPRVVLLDPPLPVESLYAASGRAVGHVHELERLFGALDRYRGEYDAVALSTQIGVDPRTRLDYYGSRGGVVNPWGGVEARRRYRHGDRAGWGRGSNRGAP